MTRSPSQPRSEAPRDASGAGERIESERQRTQVRQINDVEYLTREQALALLGIKKESLYTYVSRGLVKTAAHPDGRRRQYLKSDIERLKTRAGEQSDAPRVSQSLRYGKPIVQSWISEITADGPRYRGHLATDLARAERRFEVVAELLWTGILNPRELCWEPIALPPGLAASLAAWRGASPSKRSFDLLPLVIAALSDERAQEAPQRVHDPLTTGMQLLQAFAGVAGLAAPACRYTPPVPGEFLASCIARGFGCDRAGPAPTLINAALVLSAEHELSAPTFSARICASTGADLYACVASAIHAQSGSMQVGGTADVEAMFEALLESPGGRDAPPQSGANEALNSVPAGYSRSGLPCFNHPLYGRDPRAEAILQMVAQLDAPAPGTARILAFIEHAYRVNAQYPNIFAALVVLALALGLPPGSAALLHTIGRTAGWLAHAIEQRLTGAMLRPRARYMGDPPAERARPPADSGAQGVPLDSISGRQR